MTKKYLLTTDDVDSTMSTTSTNPVQNKVIKSVVDAKLDIQQAIGDAGKAPIADATGKLVMTALPSGGTQSDWSQTTTTELDYIKNKPFQSLGTGLTKNSTTNALDVNIVSSFQSTPDDTHVASEKLVSDQLVTKQAKIAAGTSGQVITYSGTAGTVGALAVDSAVTASSTNLITSGAVSTAVAAKQDKIAAGTSGQVVTYSGTAGTVGALAVDSAPTASSTNLVQSGGVLTALDAKLDDSQLKTAWSATVSDSNIPSEKLVKDTVDGKIAYNSTSTNKVFTIGKDTTGWFIDDGA